MAHERLEAVIRGRVQMVGFRAFAQRKAMALALTGHVTNLPDGTVAVVAEGERPGLEAFLRALRRGPAGARVEAVDYRWADAEGALGAFAIGSW